MVHLFRDTGCGTARHRPCQGWGGRLWQPRYSGRRAHQPVTQRTRRQAKDGLIWHASEAPSTNKRGWKRLIRIVESMPENCLNPSRPVVTRCDVSSAGISSFSINNSFLKTPERLREAGAGGSNPLTPTKVSLDFSIASISLRRALVIDKRAFLPEFCRNRFRQFPQTHFATDCATWVFRRTSTALSGQAPRLLYQVLRVEHCPLGIRLSTAPAGQSPDCIVKAARSRGTRFNSVSSL
jgi:hypothetical protein